MSFTIGLSLFLLFELVPSQSDRAIRFEKVTLDEMTGYIIPSEYAEGWFQKVVNDTLTGYWIPDRKDIIEAEKVVNALIERGSVDPIFVIPAEDTALSEYMKQELEVIKNGYTQYQRQYIGFVVKGKRMLYMNYFRDILIDDRHQPDRHWINGYDFGTSLWQIEYDVVAKRCTWFKYNNVSFNIMSH